MSWFAVACVSILVNALLLQQLLLEKIGADPEVPQQNDTVVTTLASEIARLSARDISDLGQLFFHQKVSELLMPKDVQAEIGFSNASWEKENPMTGLAVDMLSVHLQPEEAANQVLFRETVSRLRERLDDHGVVVIQGLHNTKDCRLAARHVHSEIMSPWATFSNIRDNKYRKDLALPMRGHVMRLLRKTLSVLAPVFEATLGPNASLVEFSSLTTYSGAGPQAFHADSSMESVKRMRSLGRMFSAFIYLDDVRPESAPLDVVPGTHTHFQFLMEDEQEMMTSVPFARLAVPQGSIAIYDSRTLHRGAANTSPFARPTIYFSLAEQHKLIPIGPVYSLRHGYRQFPLTINNVILETIPDEVLADGVLVHSDEKCRTQLQQLCPAKRFAGDPDRQFDCAWFYFTGNEESDEVGRVRRSQPLQFTSHPGVKERYQAQAFREEDEVDRQLDRQRRELRDANGNPDYQAALALTLTHRGSDSSYPLDRRISNCGVASRMEMILKRGIFAEDFVANVSWGTLLALPSQQ